MSLNALPLSYRIRHLDTAMQMRSPFVSPDAARAFARDHLRLAPDEFVIEPENPEQVLTERCVDVLESRPRNGSMAGDWFCLCPACGQGVSEERFGSHAWRCTALRARVAAGEAPNA